MWYIINLNDVVILKSGQLPCLYASFDVSLGLMSLRKPWDNLDMYINMASLPCENEDVFLNFPTLKTLCRIPETAKNKKKMRFLNQK